MESCAILAGTSLIPQEAFDGQPFDRAARSRPGRARRAGGPRRIAQSPIKIGVIQPLSGPVAASGNYVRMGAEIARDWINAKGGVNGRKVELVIEDNKSDPKEAASAAEKLIVRDKVPAIMGAWGSLDDAGRHAEARGVRRADGGRDLQRRLHHQARQPVDLPHQPAQRDGSPRPRAVRGQARRQARRLPGRQHRLGPRRRSAPSATCSRRRARRSAPPSSWSSRPPT